MSLGISVIRDLPSENSVSMERYADELEVAADCPPDFYTIRPGFPEGPHEMVHSPLEKLGRYKRRYVDYPLHLRQSSADVFHIADHAYSYLLRGLPCDRTVVTCHDVMLLTQDEWREKPKWSPAVTLFRYSISHLRLAAKVITVSDVTRRDLLKFDLAEDQKIEVVPPPVSPVFKPAHGEDRDILKGYDRIDDSSFLVLHVGSPGRYKNISTVLKVIAELRRRGVPATLIRVGRHLAGAEALAVSELGISRWVQEVGSLRDDELAAMYRACDVLLFPSFKEGFGWPVIEAMASGLPVVASDAASINESLAGSGVQLSSTDVRGYSDILEFLWKEPTRLRSMTDAGLGRALAFSRATVGQRLQSVYSSVVSDGST